MTLITTQILNQHCQSYPEQFSPERQAAEMIRYAFQMKNGRDTEKCNREAPWRQDGSRCPVIDNGEKAEIIDNIATLTPDQKRLYSTAEGIVALNKTGISIAVERRVALFFQQAILCHKMSAFTFSLGGADGQIGTSPKLNLGERVVHKREAAHSSTNPSVIAHAKDGSTPNGFIYLKGGSSYAQHNATIGMNECVNGADEIIDGKGTDNKLRATSVKIPKQIWVEAKEPF